jgi:hypothetical protein
VRTVSIGKTLVKCDLMYLVEKERLYRRRGSVGHGTPPRAGPAPQCLFRIHAGLKE